MPVAVIYAGGSVRTVPIGSRHDGPVINALRRDKERDHDWRYNARIVSIQVDLCTKPGINLPECPRKSRGFGVRKKYWINEQTDTILIKEVLIWESWQTGAEALSRRYCISRAYSFQRYS